MTDLVCHGFVVEAVLLKCLQILYSMELFALHIDLAVVLTRRPAPDEDEYDASSKRESPCVLVVHGRCPYC